VILIAQSLGGFTAPLAAAPPVSAVVLVNAMIPVPGETPGAWRPRSEIEADAPNYVWCGVARKTA
jgi:hypothetical protein